MNVHTKPHGEFTQDLVERLIQAAAFPALIAAILTLTVYVVATIVMNRLEPETVIPAVGLQAEPCAVTTPQQLQDIRLQPTRRFAFRGVTYGLHRGFAECTVSRQGGYLDKRELVFCEFSNPGALEVTMGNRTYAFAPGATRPATIWFDGGVPRCGADSSLNRVRRLMQLRAANG